MKDLSPIHLFAASAALYALAAVLPVFFRNRQKAGNIASHLTCMAAAAAGLASSLMQLSGSGEAVTVEALRTSIPLFAFTIRLDSLSAFFVLGLSVIAFCSSLYSIGYLSHYYGKRNVGLFNFLYSSFILSMLLVLTSGNAVFFLFAWELMSGLSYFLVVFESEHEENRRAGVLYLIMTGLGTAFLLAAILLMVAYTGSFDLTSAAAIPPGIKNMMFALFLIGFGTKAGIIPLHLWLPAAHPAAPSNVSALMSGVMIKTAIYGLLRFVFQYLGVKSAWWGAVLLAVGAVSAVLGVSYALMEQNVKRLLAYSSIENIGIILIGIGASMLAFSSGNAFAGSLAMAACLLHTFNHTVFKGGLFLGAGAMQYATRTKDIEKLGGLIRRMPMTALLMLCFSLAISALAPLNGFVSEWLTFQSLFAGIAGSESGLNILAMLSVAALAMSGALAVACFAKLFGISFLGKPRTEQASEAREAPGTMRVGMAVLAAICLAAGLFPAVFLKVIDPVVTGLNGTSLSGQLQGGFLLAWVKLDTANAGISPLGLLALLAAIAALTLAVVRIAGGKYIERKYGTWDCGYEALTERMQYTATGFSKPLKIVFKALFRPSRKLKAYGGTQYHPDSMEYTMASESLFEKYLYDPITSFFKKLSHKSKYSVQTGSIRRYLAYIFTALLLLMLYNIIV